MEGISKERLLEIIEITYQVNKLTGDYLKNVVALNVRELNPWLPIADAPKDRFLLLYSPDIEGVSKKFVGRIESCWYWEPTHYQELPEDPK